MRLIALLRYDEDHHFNDNYNGHREERYKENTVDKPDNGKH
jgi:hypothetical protein